MDDFKNQIDTNIINSEKVFFVHVPKCGGTSVGRAIKLAYFTSGIFRRHRGIVNIYGQGSSSAANLFGEPLGVYRNKLVAYFLSNRSNRLVQGHVPFDRNVYEAFGRSWNYVTILRDPVERWYSEYFYNFYKDSEHFKHNMSIQDYLQSEQGVLSASTYIRYFCSESNSQDMTSEESIERAKENLKQFTLVGFLDDVDGFVREFKKRIGKRIRIGHRNRNPAQDKIIKKSDSVTHNKVIELCKADLELYKWAKQYFNGNK